MQLLPVKDLVPHPQNEYFFDDISGESWAEFLRSIETSGVIEPVVINQNKLIISGHQRVRACKELGIAEVMTETRQYDTEDQMLKDLIETNIRQRGIGNPNPVKFGRCIKTLERIYGIQHGGDRKSKDNNCLLIESPKTEQELADTLGVSLTSIKNYKKLADMIPEIQNLIETGVVTPTTARAIVKNLSIKEQCELAEQLADISDKVSKRELDFYIKRVNELTDEKARLEQQLYKPITIEDLTADEIDGIKEQLADRSEKGESKNATVDELNKTIETLRSQLSQKQKEYELIKEQNETLKDDNNHIRLSMDGSSAEVYANCKALDYISRIDRVVKDELNNLELYGDLENLEEVVVKRLDEVARDLISRLKDFQRRLYTVDVIEVVDID